MAETEEPTKENHASATYQQGIDDFYQSQAESQKKKLDTIHEYLLYIMSPFVYEEDMDEFCTDLLRFAMDHNYRPEVEWKRFKTKLSSFDVRHLVWSIALNKLQNKSIFSCSERFCMALEAGVTGSTSAPSLFLSSAFSFSNSLMRSSSRVRSAMNS